MQKKTSAHVKRQADKHVDRVAKALLWWTHKTLTDDVELGVEVTFNHTKCIIVAYNFQYPSCYIIIRPVSSTKSIGAGRGMGKTINF